MARGEARTREKEGKETSGPDPLPNKEIAGNLLRSAFSGSNGLKLTRWDPTLKEGRFPQSF